MVEDKKYIDKLEEEIFTFKKNKKEYKIVFHIVYGITMLTLLIMLIACLVVIQNEPDNVCLTEKQIEDIKVNTIIKEKCINNGITDSFLCFKYLSEETNMLNNIINK